MTFLFHLILLQPADLNWEKDGKRAVSKHRRAIQGKTMQITNYRLKVARAIFYIC